MSTRSSSSNLVPPSTNPESIIRNRRQNLGDPSRLLDFEEINMANDPNNVQGPPPVGPNFQNPNPDLRSMKELLQAPTDGVGDAIVCMSTRSCSSNLVPPSTNPESIIQNRRRNLGDPSRLLDFEEINMANNPNNVQGPPLVGPNFQNPNPDLRSMEELLQAPTNDGVGDAIVGAARTWIEKEPPNSITTWNDLVSKFVNLFFPPSKTTNLRNEITRFQQRFGETFSEAWDRFKDLLNKCPHHVFSSLHQIDTFYNSLNQSEQDSLNSAANCNFLTKNTQEALTIIENKSKVQTSRNKPQVSSASGSSTQDAAITALTKQVEALVSSMNRPINLIQNGCETCGGPHAYYECQAAGGYTQEDVYATSGTYNLGGNNYLEPPGFNNLNQGNNQGYNQGNNQGNYQNNQNRRQNQNQNLYNQGSQNQGYNQNKGQNYNQGNNYNQGYNQNQSQNVNQNQAQPNVSSLEEMMLQHMRSTEAKIQQIQTHNNQQIQQMQNHNTQQIQKLQTQNNQLVNLMGQMQKVLHERPQCALQSNTKPNSRKQVNSITTRSGLTTTEPSIPHPVPPTPREEVEREPETLMDEVHITSPTSTAHVPPPRIQPVSPPKPKEDPKPNPLHLKIPYPLRLNKTKLLNKNDVQVPEKLDDPRKFPIPCILQDLEVCNSLANSGASINLMPLSIYEKLRIGPLKPTRMTLELANRSVIFPMGIDEDVIVKVYFALKRRVLAVPLLILIILFQNKNHSVLMSIILKRRVVAAPLLIRIFLFLNMNRFILIFRLITADRSDSHHEEFADELTHIISSPEYDCFYFDIEPDPGESTILFEENISDTLTKDVKIHELNDFPLFLSKCDSIFSEKFFEIDLLVLFPSGNKDEVFDPGIFTINGVHSKRCSILLLDDFSSILFVIDFLFLTGPSEIETFLSFPSRNEDKVFDPGILLNNGIFSFTRKSPHLLIDNLMIDNCHILSEISLKIVSSICFLPMDKEIRGESS
ncbi:reverse transcriptase domain-containing protein [Tanacetum coccineum]